MGNSFILKADIAFSTAQKAIGKALQCEKTWEENMTILEEKMSHFKGDTEEAKEMRKHILHCKHKETTFEDFIFLTMGPLEYGVFYNILKEQGIAKRNTNEARNNIRNEMKRAVEMIVSFPEFENWKFKNKPPKVGLKFVEAILENDYDKQGSEPKGYIRALYRIRMFYKQWTQGNQKQVLQVRLEGDKMGSVLKNISRSEWIKFLSEAFQENVQAKLQSLHHLDYFTEGKSNEKNDSNNEHAKIYKTDLDDRTKVFVVRKAMSPGFVKELKEKMNLALFMAYSEPREDKHVEGRRIRIASESYTEFLVGKGPGTKRFASNGMLDVERKLLQSMNVMLEMYGELFEKVLNITVRKADQLQEVKDSLKKKGYGAHNDQAGLCCLCNGENGKEGVNEMDAPEYMLVATYVLSSQPTRNTAKVTWFKEGKDGKNVTTSDNDIHFQGLFCQTSYQHKIESIKGVEASDYDYRLVFSARATMHFQRDDEMRRRRTLLHYYGVDHEILEKELPRVRNDYRYQNVLHGGGLQEFDMKPKSTNISDNAKKRKQKTEKGNGKKRKQTMTEQRKGGNIVGERASEKDRDSQNTLEEGQKEKLEVQSFSLEPDTYGNAPHHSSDPVAQNNPVIIDEPFYKLGTSQRFYEAQIKERIYYEVMVDKKEVPFRHFGPYIENGKAVKVGSLVETRNVEKFLGIPQGHKEGSVCWNADHVNGILMRHAYKNDVRGIKRIIDGKTAHSFWVGLTGGNPEVRGQTVVQAAKATTNRESGYFPSLQCLNKHNISLLDAALGNRTVTIFLQQPGKKEMSYYLGCFYLNGFQTHKESIASLRETARECNDFISDKEGFFTRFQERTHVRVGATPYEMPEEKEEETWKKIVIHESDVFPIGEGLEDHVEPMEILSLNTERSVSFDQACNEFLEKGNWRDLIEKEYHEMDDVTHEFEIKERSIVPGRSFYFSMDELLQVMVCVAVGVFCRLQQMNVVGKHVTPLRNNVGWYKSLGSIVQTYPSPHPGRVYDLTPLLLILSSGSENNGRGERMGFTWMKANAEKSKEFIFAAIVATTTGRMAAFYQWTNYKRLTKRGKEKKDNNEREVTFPKPDELEHFIEFLGKATKLGKMGPFLSGQFKRSLPSCVNNFHSYMVFLRQVAGKLEDLHSRMVHQMERRTCTKEDLVQIMVDFFENMNTGDGNIQFVASQIIYNIDEMINLLPDQDWENVEMGYGSKQAMDWLITGSKVGYLKTMQNYVKKLGEEKLTCLGLKKIGPRGTTVVWALNNRPLGLHDMEHFACKLWYMMVRVVGARPSRNPKLHRPHLHPLRIDNLDISSIYGDHVINIAKRATNTFKRVVEDKKTKDSMTIPSTLNNW